MFQISSRKLSGRQELAKIGRFKGSPDKLVTQQSTVSSILQVSVPVPVDPEVGSIGGTFDRRPDPSKLMGSKGSSV